jgi:hypothetical protein
MAVTTALNTLCTITGVRTTGDQYGELLHLSQSSLLLLHRSCSRPRAPATTISCSCMHTQLSHPPSRCVLSSEFEQAAGSCCSKTGRPGALCIADAHLCHSVCRHYKVRSPYQITLGVRCRECCTTKPTAAAVGCLRHRLGQQPGAHMHSKSSLLAVTDVQRTLHSNSDSHVCH